MKLRSTPLRALLLLMLSMTTASAWALSFNQIVVFGDSLSDTGNYYNLTGNPPSPPYYSGRASNGPVWVERFAQLYGLPAPTPSTDSGLNFAFYGAETSLSGLSSLDNTPNVGEQIKATTLAMPGVGYLNSHKPLASDLFIIWAGANDLINSALSGMSLDPSVPVTNLANNITILANAGARQFLVPNLPPLGKTPLFIGTASEDFLNTLVATYNSLLKVKLQDLQANLGIEIIQPDIYSLFQDGIANPTKFGLTNVTDSAYDGTTIVPNPDQYLFWDVVHPTGAFHRIIGDYVWAVIPEPGILTLFAVGFVMLYFNRKQATENKKSCRSLPYSSVTPVSCDVEPYRRIWLK